MLSSTHSWGRGAQIMQPDYPGVPRDSGEAQNGAGEGMYVK